MGATENKKRIMTSLENDLYEFVRYIAYRKDTSVSEVVRDCVAKAKENRVFADVLEKPIEIDIKVGE